MNYQFNYRPYQRQFRQPLNTSHGIWKVREGIIIRLTDDLGNRGWGEVAPIPWFCSETLAQGLAFCQELGQIITEEDIYTISTQFPACQFGFESALEHLSHAKAQRQGSAVKQSCWRVPRHKGTAEPFRVLGSPQVERLPRKGRRKEERKENYCFLLPAGEGVLLAAEEILKQYPLPITLKWKIGVYSFDVEIEIFKHLCQMLPSGVKLRLDANGGLSLKSAQQWLQVADKMGKVEFIEQPLSPDRFEIMLALSQDYATPLALDESVAAIQQLEECYQKGWRGIFIIKAAIIGSPRRLRQFMSQHPIDAVFSSVFETKIGRQAALGLARELSNKDRAVGFGVDHWFIEDEDQWLMSLWNNF